MFPCPLRGAGQERQLRRSHARARACVPARAREAGARCRAGAGLGLELDEPSSWTCPRPRVLSSCKTVVKQCDAGAGLGLELDELGLADEGADEARAGDAAVEVLLELEVDEVHLPGEAQHTVQPPLRLARQHHVPRLRPPRRQLRHGVHRVADVAQRG